MLSWTTRSSGQLDGLGSIERLARNEDHPRPGQQLARSGKQGALLGLAAVDEALIAGVDRVRAAQGAQRTPGPTGAQGALALARNQGAAEARAAVMGLPIQAAVGHHALGGALGGALLAGERTVAFTRHQQWK